MVDASPPLRSLLLASRKGGAGKTTLALHLGVILATRTKVLLVDADEQASAWYRVRAAAEPRLVTCPPARCATCWTPPPPRASTSPSSTPPARPRWST
jgi:hypothetical protein